jgi:phosphopantothenoylcysteine decarboxylase/phosphopantothenate--cysteine ligase
MQIILGITGGVAAYKAADLARMLTHQGHRVRCILTEAGSRFITPLTLTSLTGEPCFGANPDQGEWRATPGVEHIDLARWADLVAVVPATADILGKAAHGLANDLLSTVLLATRAPILWAPAMNTGMWEHPAVQANVATLRGYGHGVVEPASGILACGEEGAGKLADIGAIAEAIQCRVAPKLRSLAGRRVLITAGPTREDLDPVRMISNRSTGSMGVELARAFRDAGAQVALVLGGELPEPWGVETRRVRSAQEMLAACEDLWPDADGLVAAAAVADQRPDQQAREKVKKADGPETLTLVRTPDILATLAGARKPHQWTLGFAAESEQHLALAAEKLQRKKLDAILVNDIQAGRAFGSQANTLTPITPQGTHHPLGPLPKDALARAVVQWWHERLEAREAGA